MDNARYRDFLQNIMPVLHLRWAGFRRVRDQVYKRLACRISALGLADIEQYRTYLDTHESEWKHLDFLCRITISRFYRDRVVFDAVRDCVLPELANKVLAEGTPEITSWSAGCCCGEEAYTLQIIWHLAVTLGADSPVVLRTLATDHDEAVLAKAREGCYQAGSLRELPRDLIAAAFTRQGELFCIRQQLRKDVSFLCQDIRLGMPQGPFHLVFCRNFVLTYFDDGLQRDVLGKIVQRLAPGGYLVIGKKESLPEFLGGLVPCGKNTGIFMKAPR